MTKKRAKKKPTPGLAWIRYVVALDDPNPRRAYEIARDLWTDTPEVAAVLKMRLELLSA